MSLMRVPAEFYPMLLLDIDDEDVVTLSFRTPSPQAMRAIQAAGKEAVLRNLMSRLGDDLDTHLAHMEAMKPTGQIAEH